MGSSNSSTNLCSNAPENGIIKDPGSFLSTHSLIFINLEARILIEVAFLKYVSYKAFENSVKVSIVKSRSKKYA